MIADLPSCLDADQVADPPQWRYDLDLLAVLAIDLASKVYTTLSGMRSPDDPGVGALATLYASTQLLFIAVERISSASARASVIGATPAVTMTPFAGSVVEPSGVLGRHINLAIGKPANTTITQEALVTYLVEGRVLDLVAASFPELETIASIVAGETPGALGAGFSAILSNIGAFAPAQGGGVDARAVARHHFDRAARLHRDARQARARAGARHCARRGAV